MGEGFSFLISQWRMSNFMIELFLKCVLLLPGTSSFPFAVLHQTFSGFDSFSRANGFTSLRAELLNINIKSKRTVVIVPGFGKKFHFNEKKKIVSRPINYGTQINIV